MKEVFFFAFRHLLIVHIFIYSIKPDTIQKKKENLVPNKWSAAQQTLRSIWKQINRYVVAVSLYGTLCGDCFVLHFI